MYPPQRPHADYTVAPTLPVAGCSESARPVVHPANKIPTGWPPSKEATMFSPFTY